MLSRKVVTRSGRGFRGYFPSKKLNRMVEYESILERDAIVIFEQSEAVKTYREQPALVYYYEDGVPRKYFPDFEVVLDTGDVVHIEVKPACKLINQALAKKYQSINQLYLSRQEHFVIFTDKVIRETKRKDIYHLIELASGFPLHGEQK